MFFVDIYRNMYINSLYKYDTYSIDCSKGFEKYTKIHT